MMVRRHTTSGLHYIEGRSLPLIDSIIFGYLAYVRICPALQRRLLEILCLGP